MSFCKQYHHTLQNTLCATVSLRSDIELGHFAPDSLGLESRTIYPNFASTYVTISCVRKRLEFRIKYSQVPQASCVLPLFLS